MTEDAKLLESRVISARAKIRLIQKAKYQLAKLLGFSAQEAAVLQNWSEKRIHALAESKKQGL